MIEHHPETLLSEIGELRRRLAEAEERLHSIRSEGSDAPLITDRHDDQAFALHGAEQPFRVLVEAMSEGALMLSPTGTILYCNQSFATFVQTPLDQVIGTQLRLFVVPEDRPKLTFLLTNHLTERTRAELRLIADDDSIVPVIFSSQVFDTGGVRRFCITVTNLRQMKLAEEALRRSEALWRTLIETLPVGLWVIDQQGQIVQSNPASLRIWGGVEFVGPSEYHMYKTWCSNNGMPIGPDDWASTRALRTGETSVDEVIDIECFDGTRKTILNSAAPIRDKFGNIIAALAVNQDITQLKQTEKYLQKSLAEKEVLLKEIHHRVKNNLQIISSLLNLQASYIMDPHLREYFLESQRRIRSIALVHELLYQSPDLASIDFATYVRSLVDYLVQSFCINSSTILTRTAVEHITVDLDQAIPIGLLINELVSNSFKHAFPQGGPGEVWVRLERDERQVRLVVSDTGIGLPKDLDIATNDSLGLQLIDALVKQLHGSMRWESQKGTIWTIWIPEKATDAK